MREVPHTVKRTNKNDLFLRLTAVQLAVCLAVAAVIGAVYKLNGQLFGEMRERFVSLMSDGFDLTTGVPKLRRSAESTAPNAEDTETTAENTATETSGKTEKDSRNSENGTKTESEDAADGDMSSEKTVSADSTALSAGGVDLSEQEAEDCLNFAFYESGDVPCLPVSGHVTSVFGKRVHPIYGTDGFHSGTDIAAEKGTPVLAALDGTVCDAGVGESAGNYVKLCHEGGLYTLYCHLDSANTEKGVRIRKGDVIGFVGETGLATGPHLHFEVQRDGEKLDPSFLLKKAVELG